MANLAWVLHGPRGGASTVVEESLGKEFRYRHHAMDREAAETMAR